MTGLNETIVGGMVGQQFYDPNSQDYQPLTLDLSTAPLTLLLYDSTGTNPRPRKVTLKVSGVLQSQNGGSYDGMLLLPLNDVIEYNEWSSGVKIDPKTFTFDQVTIRTTSRETTNAVSDAVRKLGYMPGGMGEFLNQLNGFFTTMRLMLGGIGGVALLVAAFGVANTMTMAILERTKEIGLMKAIGATDRDVLTVFLMEAGMVGFSGGVAGVGVALALQNAVNSALRNQPQTEGGGGMNFLPFDTSQIGGNLLVIPPELIFFAILLAMGVGLGAGLYPALRAARLPPVVALKSE
jgi:putative ABC transport system permease protein